MRRLEIGDAIWFMKDNKPVCYYVWEVRTTQCLTHKSEYGYPYDHEILETRQYKVGSDKNNNYKTDFQWIHDIEKVQTIYYNKEDLINSL